MEKSKNGTVKTQCKLISVENGERQKRKRKYRMKC